MFISLHNHTEKSNVRMLDCIIKPKDLIKKAISLGYKGIAITDHECLSAAIDVLKTRDAIEKEHPDFKIIFGNEIYLIDEKDYKNNPRYYHFILLAKDLEGWQQLKQLSSRAWGRSYMERGLRRCPTFYSDLEEIVGKNQGHILAQTACIGGELACDILAHKVPEANAFVRWCIATFGKDNFALELQPSDSEEQTTVNKVLVRLAKHYGIPFLVTTDSHYLDKEDFGIHSAFLNSRQSSDRETEKFYKYTYVMSEDEIKELLKSSDLSDEDIELALSNTIEFTKDVEKYDFRHPTIVPQIKIPPFTFNHSLYNKGYDFIDKFYNSDSDQDRYLIYQIEQGIIKKHVEITPIILERINKELDILDYLSQNLKQKLSAYLNLTVNIIDLAWQVSLVGPARGSSTGFLINYLISITQVSPLDYDLKEWRFLNKERVELPDVDADFQPEKTEEIVEILRKEYGEDNVLNCATFKTESLKSAILTCARGLGYNNDEAQALASLVPAHRGITYSLKDCIEGDEEKDLPPVPNFEEKFNKYPGLLDAVRKIEGLSSNASIHASALYVFNNGYLPQNSLMMAPNGTKITAFNMHDSDDQGALKMDVLRTDAQSKIAKCLDLLLKDKQIEWQGSLRATYDKYLHPDVLEYKNPEMWKQMADGSIQNLFQMDSPVGSVAMAKARPENIRQLAEINSIMRLQAEEGEQPIDRYVRFRNDIQEWYKEMEDFGLVKEEMDILEKYLLQSNGVSGSQEVLMQILMDPSISNFTLKEANAARKAISKKLRDQIVQLEKDFYKKGEDLFTRKVFLDYVWEKCIKPQLGYSFSINHTVPYSIVALQEANLATKWNPLYWQCACLCINAGQYVEEVGEEEEEEPLVEVSEEDEDDDSKKRTVAPNYGKIAKAIDDAQHSGVRIELPEINKAGSDFIPDTENNSIIYSLSTVNVVSDKLYDDIVNNRPYKSLEDFLSKVEATPAQMLGLIKAGCFDSLEKVGRLFTIRKYLNILAEEQFPVKDKLTSVHLKKALDMGIDLTGYETEIRYYKYKKYLDKDCLNKETKRYIINHESAIKFFKTFVEKELNISKGEYGYFSSDEIFIKASSFERVYKNKLQRLMDYINTEEGRKNFAEFERKKYTDELFEKYCSGSVSSWEMATMCFYHDKHELSGVNNSLYNIRNFEELPEESENPALCAIAGTVTNADNAKHIVSLSTIYGTVNVKFFAGNYTLYNQKISSLDPKTKKKVVLDQPWFKRGTKIIVYGFRRENMFVSKTDRSSGYNRTVGLIENIRPDGSLEIRYKRNK